MKIKNFIRLYVLFILVHHLSLYSAIALNDRSPFSVLPELRSLDYFFSANQNGKGSGEHSIFFVETPIYSGQSISQYDETIISLDENGNYYIHFIANVLPRSNKTIVMKLNGTPIATTVCDENNKLSLQRIIEVVSAPVTLEFVGEERPIYLQSKNSAFISIIRLNS